ncbi:MAG: hypothetical protein EHM18_08160 [Acidobacteria bacterium]|nr:MAG: hypothetical protein EHM18_08160 [Acidobacteriota bacterium]
MRKLADAGRISLFMKALGAATDETARVYFTGGATAVLLGWRATTIDVDIWLIPDSDALLRALPRLKERLEINIELACPSNFIPEVPGWQDRSRFIAQENKLSFLHYDLYSQALAKIERSHTQDVADVGEMLRRSLVEPESAWELFQEIEPMLYRYPAVDPQAFRRRVQQFVRIK